MGNESIKKKTQKLFIEPLEQRIMLDGAGASTFLDLIDERNQQQIKINSSNKDIYKEGDNFNKDIPFTNITRDKIRNDKKNIVFIDSAVEDYETITSSFKENTEFYLINANEDGFKRISEILSDRENIDALHLIGHGSAGQILFGNAFLNNETIDNYQATLASIGQSLTTSGDILFYGCNVASTEQGEILIKKISEITKADIAASDDITGKGGDWELEKKIGIIETKNVQVLDYQSFLSTADAYGISSINTSTTEENHSATNFKAQSGSGNNNGQQASTSADKFIITQERSVVTSGSSLSFDVNAAATSSITPSSSNPINVYMLYLNDVENRRDASDRGQVTFEHEILGVFTNWDNTIFMSGISKSGATYPDSSGTKVSKRELEWYNGAGSGYAGPGISGQKDYFIISNSNKTISVGADNGDHGDFVRIVTRASPPSAVNDTGYIDEGSTLSVSNSASAVSGTSTGSHSGDVENNDTDSANHTLTVTSYSHSSATNTSGGSASSGNGNSGTAGSSSVDGYYGTLDLEANGSYTYAASNDISGLDSGETVTDVFTYTITDGVSTDTATITITIIGQSANTAPVARNDVGHVAEDGTLQVDNGDNANVSGSYDAAGEHSGDVLQTSSGTHQDTDADSDTLTVTAIRTGSVEGSGTAGSLGSALTGSYGQLTLNSNGSYTYVANQSAADALDVGDTVTDVFNYTVSDGNGGTDTATITITIIGVNDTPVAQNDVGVIVEDGTLPVANSANANLSGSYDATGEHSGDVIDTSSSSHTDSDADASASLTVTAIRVGSSEDSGTAGSIGSALTGTYGQLTIAADGSYSYVANQDLADALDVGDSVTDSFNYTISDGTATDIGVITITILGANDNPTAVNDTDAVIENNAKAVSSGSELLVADDTDADDSSSLTVTQIAVTGGSNSSVAASSSSFSNGTTIEGTYGTLQIGADGSYYYGATKPAAYALDTGDTVTDSFTYTVSDGTATSTATLIITVTGINTAPTAVNDTDSVNEDATITESSGSELLVADDTDADASSSLTVTQIAVTGGSNSSVAGSSTYNSNFTTVTGTYGTLKVGADGSYTYVADQAAADALDAGDTETDSFTYTVSDGTATSTATLIITVTGINDDPTAVADTGYIKEGGTLTVANSAAANSGTSTGNHTGDMTDNDTDADASSTATITSITATTASGSAQTTFSSNSETVTGAYGTLTINSNGSYSYVANSNISGLDAGGSNITDVFTYIVSDGTATSTATLTINVIASQDLTARNDTGTVNEDATLTVSNDGNATSVTSATYDSSPFSLALQETGPRELAFSNDGKKFFVVGFQGQDVNEYHMTTAFDVSTATFDSSFSVSGQETYPHGLAFNLDGTKMFVSGYAGSDVNEYTLNTAWDVSTANFVDSFSVSSQDTEPRGLAFSNDGTKMFITGNAGDTIEEYTLTTGYDVSSASHTRSMSISSYDNNVRGITFNSDGTRMFFCGSQNNQIHEFTLGSAFNISSPTYIGATSLTSFDTGAEAIVFNNDGSKLFVVGNTDNDVSEYTLASPFNLTNVSGEHSGDAINTSSTDNYDTDPDSDTLTVTAIRTGSSEGSGTDGSIGSALTGTYGQLTIAANGSYTYVANQDLADALDPGDVVTDTFNYTVSDGQGETDIAVLTITVIGINDAPVADAETGSVDISQTLTVTDGTSDLLHGDTDADASASLSVSSIVATTASGSATAVNPGTAYNSGYTSVTGSKGTLRVGADGTYQYIAGSSTGTDVFTYTLSDGTATHTATLTITVSSSNNAPSATNDTDAVNEDATITESSGSELLVADDTDADSDTLTVTQIAVTGGSNSSVTSSTTHSNGTSITGTYGTLVVGANGSYTYTADQSAADDLDASDTATDSFTYTVSDGTDTDTATLIITVTGINDAPVADDETGAVNEDATLTVTDGTSDVLHGDTDADDSASLTATTYSHTSATNESGGSASSGNGNNGTAGSGAVVGYYGTLTLAADGTYTYAADQSATDLLDASDTVTDVFTYTVSDGSATDTATITITVTGINDAPVAQNDTGTVNEDATLTVSNSGNAAIVAGASHDGTPYAINEGSIRSLTFNHDGTKMFVVHASTPAVISQHALTTAFDITTASQSTTYDVSSHTTSPRGLRFNSDGTKLYLNSDQNSNKKVYEFSLSTAYDISSLSSPSSTVVSGQDGNPRGIAFNTDGSKMFLLGDSNDTVYEYSLSTAFDTTSISYTNRSLDFSSRETTPRGLSFNSTGTKLFITGQNSDDILEYDLSTGFNLSTASYNGTYDMTGTVSSPNDIVFNNDGTKAFIGQTGSNKIFSFSLSSPYSLVDITGENTGDVLDTSSSSNSDSDPDTSASLTVSAIRTGSSEGSGISGSVGSALTGTYGQLTIAANGSYSYVANQSAADDLDAGDIVTDSFNYTISDGTATDTAVITITVIGVNDTPAADNETGAVNEDATLTVSDGTSDLLHGDTDADDSASLTVSAIRTGAEGGSGTAGSIGSGLTGTYGTLTVAADGTYTYVADQSAADDLDASDTATDVFTYTVSDGTTSDTATLTITITGVNDTPVAVNDTDAVNEDATVTRTSGSSLLMDDDSDADDDDSFTVTQIAVTGSSDNAVTANSTYNSGSPETVIGTYGTLTVGANGTYTYVADRSAADDLDASDTATDSFTYTISDGTATDTATLIFTVTGVNDVPTASNNTVTTNEDTAYIFSASDFGYTDADDDDALVSIKITTLEDAGALQYNNGSAWVDVTLNQVITATDIAANKLRFNPTANENGSSYTTFNFTVNDGDADSATPNTITVNVTAVNDAPVADDETGAVNEDATLTVTDGTSDVLHGDTDVDSGDTLVATTYSHTSATDQSGGSASSGNGNNGTAGSGAVVGYYGTLTLAADGTYTYAADQSAADDLDASDTATDVFTYTLSDGTATDTATITITVTGVNDAPVAVNDTDAVNEDATVTQSSGDSLLMADDTDADDSASLTITAIKVGGAGLGGSTSVSAGSSYNSSGTSVTGTYGTLTIGADGTYTYIADQSAADDLDLNDQVTDTFTYTVSDGTATDTATLIFTVTGVNDAPVADDETGAVNEDATLTVSDGTSDLLHGDTDADDSASLTITTYSHTSATDESSGTASSGNGNSGTAGSSAVVGYYGTLTLAADGTYTYAADQNVTDALDASDTVTDVFTYTLSDGTATDTATLTITITGVNDAPVGVADTDTVQLTDTVTNSTNGAGTVISDDTDADSSSSLSVTSITATTASGSAQTTFSSNTETVVGSYGTLTINSNGSYSYVAGSSVGTDVFTYVVSDGSLTSSTTLTFSVTAGNPPVAANDTDTVNEDATVTQSTGSGLLVADDTDADGNTLTVTQIAVTGSSNNAVTASSTYNSGSPETVTGTYGQLTVGADGSYTYVANQNGADDLDAGDQVTDSFTYTVSDGINSVTATLIITVTGINDAPVAVNDTDAVNEDATVTRTSGSSLLMDDDSDADDDDSFTVTQIAVTGQSNSAVNAGSSYNSSGTSITGTYGTLIVGADGTYTYVADQSAADDLDASDTATDSFTYTISDGDTTDTATLIFTVTGVNDLPTASNNTITTNEDTNHVFSTSDFNFSDADDSGSLNKIKITSLEDNGALQYYNGSAWVDVTLNQEITATDIANNKLRFKPDTNENGSSYTSFGFQVSDGTAYSSSSYTMTVNVTAVNDAPSATADTVSVNEDATTTVSSASSGVIDDNDTDPDSSDTLTITNIAHTNGNTESVTASTTYSNGQSITGTYGTLTIGADGTYTYIADQSGTDALDASDQVTDVFTYTLSDGTTTTTATITVTVTGVNDSPVAVNDTGSVNEDATLTVSTASSGVTQNNDTDPDTDDTSSTLVVNQITPNGGSASSVSSGTTYSNGTSVTGTYGTLTIGANGTYTYVANRSAADDLDAGDTATDVFTYRVTDTTGATATADITITVTGINDIPTASDKTVSTAEDTPYVFSTSDFGYTDADDDDALVSIKITTLETNGALQYYNGSTWVDVTLNQVITVSDITSGYLRLNPDANENGSPYTTIKFTVNDGDADSATPNTITVNVTAVNDAPTATNDTASVNEDATLTVSNASNGVIDDNDTDTESDTLVITNIAHTNGNTESVTASTTYSNGQSIVGTYGTLTIGANGTYTYVADQNATDALDLSDQVTDVFTYTISDGNGGTDTASITVTVTGVNDAPTSTGGTITTNEDENYTLTVNDFNFSDPDDSGSLNKVKITTLETNGNLEYYNGTAWVAVTQNQEITASDITSGYLRFRPDANENGSSYTTFGYQVSDGTVYSSATTMTVNVTAVNDSPVATDDASSVNEDSNVRVRANADDLLNDDSDPESDSLTVTLIKPLNGSNTSVSSGSSTTITGTYGQLTVNSNGGYNYQANQDAADTLDTGESAQEQFVYTVSDGNGGTDTGILTITINGVEDNPNAVKDNVSLNISQSSTLTGNAITNDIDPDDSLTIVGCGQGRNPNVGTAKTVGTAFDSNYGQMTINADGTYTFVAVSNIKDLLDPGQSVTEKFYYTISDGNSTSTAMIEITVQRDNVVQELTRKEQKQIRKQIAKDRINEPSTIRLPNKTTPAKTIEQTADALDSISSTKKLSFSEGIKLVDLVAETGSLTTTDGSLDKVRAKEKDGQLNLKFKVSTDLGNQVVRYEGVMPDGSKLPDWIKVDPRTGKTTTNIPEGVEQVDFTIIAIDQQNNKKEIAVSIDPKEIKADKSIFKQAKKQNASLSVDQSGNVNIVKTNENGDVNQTETKNLNANKKQNSSNNIITQDLNLDNTNDIKNIIDTIKSDQVYQLQTINNGETLEIKVPETLLGNFEKTKLVLKDGSAIPDWVEFDPITGEINANPPEDVDKLEFKLIIERDGEIIVKDLAVDVGGDDNAQILDDKEDTKFIAFKDQLNKEHDNWEEYGSNIINRL